MKIVIRIVAFLVLLGMLAGLLISCTPAPKATDSDGKITLEFWTLQLDTFASTLNPMFAEYEKSHPNIKIKWVDVPFSEGEKRALTAMMSPKAPDVVNLNPDFSALLASRKALVNLNEAMPESERKAYLPVAIQAASLQAVEPLNTFGLPWYITSAVTLYNEEILKKAGYAKPPESYDELPRFAFAIRQKTGAYGLMPTVSENGNFLKELKKMGVPLYDENGRAVFATPEAIHLLQNYIQMYKQGTIPAETITEGHRNATDRFQAGTLAMLPVGPNFLKIIQENSPSTYAHTGISPQFPVNSAYKDFSLMLLVVPRKSAHPKEAVEFAAFITNAKNQLALAQAAPVLPSVTAALKDPYFSKSSKDDKLSQGRAISAGQLLKITQAYQVQPGQSAINKIVNDYVQLAMLGKVPEDKALTQAQDQINAMLDASKGTVSQANADTLKTSPKEAAR